MQNSILAATPVDRHSVAQERLDISRRVRTNPLPWLGQFSPQLVEELLRTYARRGAFVLDPFVGSGTLLGEAARQGLGAHGSDINPAAVALSRVYGLTSLSASARDTLLATLHDQLDEVAPRRDPPLFAPTRNGGVSELSRQDVETGLVRLWQESPHGPARDVFAALVVLCDFFQQHLNVDTVHRTWARLERVIRSIPTTGHTLTVDQADARALPLASRSVDLILTSPPYINVHNYHQKFRRSVEALDCDVLAVARCEIGSNRRNRSNRFLTVVQYALDMTLALREMARVARVGAHLILVLGRESTIRGTSFFNGELVAQLAVDGIGLALERRQERVFKNRFGSDIFEDILHLRVGSDQMHQDTALCAARRIARQTLTARRPFAPPASRANLEEAVDRVDDVTPSPMPTPSTLSQLGPPPWTT